MTHTNGSNVTLYMQKNGEFIKIDSPSGVPGTSNGCSFSADGEMLALACAVSPFVAVYDKRSIFSTQNDLSPLRFVAIALKGGEEGEVIEANHITV